MTERPALRIRFAMNRHREWVYLVFVGLENPHVLITGGSQTGKTTLEKLIIAAAASLGCIVIGLDPKLRFGKYFKDLPHVLIYRHEDPDVAAREWEGAVTLVQAEMQRRYRLDEESPTDILADQDRFPPILVVADEFSTLMEFAQAEWPSRKEKEDRAEAPIKRMYPTLLRMGAEARIFCVTAIHMAAADDLPAGTRTRALCGHRIVLGTDRESIAWQMIAGPGVAKPDVPHNQKGAANYLVGTKDPERIQCAKIENHELRDLAAQGIPILRENGHITEDGQLLLGTVPVPRPGRMVSHVAGDGTTFPEPLKASPAATVGDNPEHSADTNGRQEATSPAPPFAPPIVGNKLGAEFCGMSVDNFRKHRERHPIAGEYQVGNMPAWQEIDLQEWSMYRAENRRGKSAGKTEEAGA